MDFELTDDQRELQRIVRDVATRECPPALVREVLDGKAGDALLGTATEHRAAVARLALAPHRPEVVA